MSRARDTAGIIQYNKITVDSNNAVGIGSSIPDCKLDINGGLRVVGVSTFHSSINANGNIQIPDSPSASSGRLNIGDADDLRLYHDGTTNFIGSYGLLNLQSLGVTITSWNDLEKLADFNLNDSVDLYYDGVKKFETTPGGVDITGVATATSFSGSGSGLSSLNASQLSSGTIPDARFPATLPSASGANLTSLNASNLGSGTIPDARFPATLPSASGANLTNLPSSQLTGALPALDGSALTNLNIPAGFNELDAALFN